MKNKKALIILSALAQESRLEVFLLLLNEDNGLAVSEIIEILEIAPTTLSFHLSQLKSAGLIKAEKDGRSIIYSANKKKVKKLAKLITGKISD